MSDVTIQISQVEDRVHISIVAHRSMQLAQLNQVVDLLGQIYEVGLAWEKAITGESEPKPKGKTK